MINTYLKQKLVVKVSESLDEAIRYNGIVYDPEMIYSPDFSNPTIRGALEDLRMFDRAYHAISIPVDTKHCSLALAALFGEKHGSRFIGGCAAATMFIASAEQAKAIVRGLTDNPQEYYTNHILEHFEQHPEEYADLRRNDG